MTNDDIAKLEERLLNKFSDVVYKSHLSIKEVDSGLHETLIKRLDKQDDTLERMEKALFGDIKDKDERGLIKDVAELKGLMKAGSTAKSFVIGAAIIITSLTAIFGGIKLMIGWAISSVTITK